MVIINLKETRKYCCNTYDYTKDIRAWRKKHRRAINISKVKIPNSMKNR